MTSLDDTLLDQLASQVRAHPPLPRAEVARLLRGARSGDAGGERDILTRHHMSVALDAALARRGPADDVGEFFQEANLAVVGAVIEYAAGTGDAAGLLAHVQRAVTAQVDEVRERERRVREETEAFMRDTRLLDIAVAGLETKLGRPATTEELATVLEWTPERVEALRAILEDARRLDDGSLIPYLDDEEAHA